MTQPIAATKPDSSPSASADRDTIERLARHYRSVRQHTIDLVQGLSPEDLVAQSMPDASPGKWHLAHTTWFFEAMALGPLAGQPPHQPDWHFLFNSYYEALGARHPRPQRGLLTRPSLDEVLTWRTQVDRRVLDLLATAPTPNLAARIQLGCHHEQQHQELLVTDLKHLLSHNPLAPAWRGRGPDPGQQPAPAPIWHEWPDAGPVTIGHAGHGFAYDNEGPQHTVWLTPFALRSRPVSTGEYLEFIADGGYTDAGLWLADGWAEVRAGAWQAPLYWQIDRDGRWQQFTVWGMRGLDPAEPVAHLSFYEADAYARWAGARLPTEAEWETIARNPGTEGQGERPERLHPAPMQASTRPGEVWEWTASAYSPYPGFRPVAGAVGEYNGKFMSGQMVLRGGSCATPPGHVRPSYRNFFPPSARWQFSGLRLARDL